MGVPPHETVSAVSGRHLWSRMSDSADDDAARCGPGRRCAPLASPLRAGPSRVVPMPVAGVKGRSACGQPACRKQPVQTKKSSEQLSPDGDEPKRINRRRGEHEASRKNHRARNADDSGAFVVTTLVRFFTLRMRLRTLSERPAFRAPSVGGGERNARAGCCPFVPDKTPASPRRQQQGRCRMPATSASELSIFGTEGRTGDAENPHVNR